MFGLSTFQIALIASLLVPLILQLAAIAEIARSDFSGNGKLLWLSVLAILPLLGFILYLFIGRGQRIPRNRVLSP